MNGRLLGLGQVGAWIVAIFAGLWLFSQGNILGPVFTLLFACLIHGVLGVFIKIDQYLDRLNADYAPILSPVPTTPPTAPTVNPNEKTPLANAVVGDDDAPTARKSANSRAFVVSGNENDGLMRRPLDDSDLQRLERMERSRKG
jgi:hypothetical protein